MRPLRVLCVASAGGHLEQMLACADAFEGHTLTLAMYDFHRNGFSDGRFARRVPIIYLGETGLGHLISAVMGVFQWTWLLLTFRPHVVFSTGAELAVVPFWLGRLLFRTRCVFLETAVRQNSPSLTGRLVYPVCHLMFVQSKTLLRHYGPKARFVGMLL